MRSCSAICPEERKTIKYIGIRYDRETEWNPRLTGADFVSFLGKPSVPPLTSKSNSCMRRLSMVFPPNSDFDR